MTDEQTTTEHEHDATDYAAYAIIELSMVSAFIGGALGDVIEAVVGLIDALAQNVPDDARIDVSLPETFADRAEQWFATEQFQEYLAAAADEADDAS